MEPLSILCFVYGINLFYRGMISVSAPELSLPGYAKVLRLLSEFRITNENTRMPAHLCNDLKLSASSEWY